MEGDLKKIAFYFKGIRETILQSRVTGHNFKPFSNIPVKIYDPPPQLPSDKFIISN